MTVLTYSKYFRHWNIQHQTTGLFVTANIRKGRLVPNLSHIINASYLRHRHYRSLIYSTDTIEAKVIILQNVNMHCTNPHLEMPATRDKPSLQSLSVVPQPIVLPATPSLLTLPPEIRDKIYNDAICMLNQYPDPIYIISSLPSCTLWALSERNESDLLVNTSSPYQANIHGLWRLLAVSWQIQIEVERVISHLH